MKSYADMTPGEAVLHRALSRIAGGSTPGLRPSHVEYMSKDGIHETATAALKEAEALIDPR